MKTLMVILVSLSAHAMAKGQYRPSGIRGLEEFLIDEKLESIKTKNDIIREIKYSLINGNTYHAESVLETYFAKTNNQKAIRARYKAIIQFLKGNYRESLAALDSPKLYDPDIYPKICSLKLLNRFILNEKKGLHKEYINCSSSTLPYSKTDLFWMESLYGLYEKNFRIIDGLFLDRLERFGGSVESLKSIAKLAVYTNNEPKFVDILNQISGVLLSSQRGRELTGLAYYRLGEEKKAQEFLEGIELANAQNIMGNIALGKKKYELAYAHFKLAFKSKPNSINAINRIIPLSWILDQYSDGLKFVYKLPTDKYKIKEKRFLKAAFMQKVGRFVEAELELNEIDRIYKFSSPLKVNQLLSFNAIKLQKLKETKKYARKSCFQYDGLNCYLHLQGHIWEDLTQTITRKDAIYQDKSLTLDQILNPKMLPEIKEATYVDQSDIEELDEEKVEIKY